MSQLRPRRRFAVGGIEEDDPRFQAAVNTFLAQYGDLDMARAMARATGSNPTAPYSTMTGPQPVTTLPAASLAATKPKAPVTLEDVMRPPVLPPPPAATTPRTPGPSGAIEVPAAEAWRSAPPAASGSAATPTFNPAASATPPADSRPIREESFLNRLRRNREDDRREPFESLRNIQSPWQRALLAGGLGAMFGGGSGAGALGALGSGGIAALLSLFTKPGRRLGERPPYGEYAEGGPVEDWRLRAFNQWKAQVPGRVQGLEERMRQYGQAEQGERRLAQGMTGSPESAKADVLHRAMQADAESAMELRHQLQTAKPPTGRVPPPYPASLARKLEKHQKGGSVQEGNSMAMPKPRGRRLRFQDGGAANLGPDGNPVGMTRPQLEQLAQAAAAAGRGGTAAQNLGMMGLGINPFTGTSAGADWRPGPSPAQGPGPGTPPASFAPIANPGLARINAPVPMPGTVGAMPPPIAPAAAPLPPVAPAAPGMAGLAGGGPGFPGSAPVPPVAPAPVPQVAAPGAAIGAGLPAANLNELRQGLGTLRPGPARNFQKGGKVSVNEGQTMAKKRRPDRQWGDTEKDLANRVPPPAVPAKGKAKGGVLTRRPKVPKVSIAVVSKKEPVPTPSPYDVDAPPPPPTPRMAKGGKWIQEAVKKPGALRQQLGAKEGEKIPAKKLAAAAGKGGKLGQRARLAQTLKKMRKRHGGKCDDPKKMAVGGVGKMRKDYPETKSAAPKRMASGGRVRGCGAATKGCTFSGIY